MISSNMMNMSLPALPTAANGVGGCGGAAHGDGAMAMPQGGSAVAVGGGFGQMMTAAAAPGNVLSLPTVPAERFVQSASGGVIVGADGAPTGTIPANSFLDTSNGKIFGADGKEIPIPAGSKADFFDLPDIAMMVRDAAAIAASATTPGGTTVAAGGGPANKHTNPTQVAGQHGHGMPAQGAPASTTAGGSTAAGADCGMDHMSGVAGASGAAGASGTTAGGGAASMLANLQGILAQLRGLVPALGAGMTNSLDPAFTPSIAAAGLPTSGGGGAATAVGGASGLGQTMDSGLGSALADLMSVLRDLTKAIHDNTSAAGGGAAGFPGQKSPNQHGPSRLDSGPWGTHARGPRTPQWPPTPAEVPPTTPAAPTTPAPTVSPSSSTSMTAATTSSTLPADAVALTSDTTST